MTDLMTVEGRSLPSLTDPKLWAERRRDFNAWVNTQLCEGVDFGKIPGIDKPTLLKPGAEKVAQAYGCSPVAEITMRQQDAETGYLYVEVVVRLVHIQTGAVIATGLGSCSTYESKYRWRWEWWNEGGLPPKGEGWEWVEKRDGTVAYRRRVQNRDLIDQWNTVLKMAKKRALVDAALTVSGASEKFTQDVEDTPEEVERPTRPVAQPAKPTAGVIVTPTGRIEAPPDFDAPEVEAVLPKHWIEYETVQRRFWAWTGEQGLSHENVHAALQVATVKDYTGSMEDAKRAILAWITQRAGPIGG